MIVYVFFSCNKWHEYSSYRFLGVVEASNLDSAKEFIKKEQGYSDDDFNDYIAIEKCQLNKINL